MRSGVHWGCLTVACAGAMAATMLGIAAEAAGPQNEELAIRQTYADGVHAFFGGDYQRAYDDLSDAIAAGTQDPRAWYFRGLAAMKMGRTDEAAADFSEAAGLEAISLGDWQVARSLERIQGHDRLALERYRVRARVARLEEIRAAQRRRTSEFRGLQSEVVRPMLPEGERRLAPEKMGAEELPPAGDPPAEDLLDDDLLPADDLPPDTPVELPIE